MAESRSAPQAPAQQQRVAGPGHPSWPGALWRAREAVGRGRLLGTGCGRRGGRAVQWCTACTWGWGRPAGVEVRLAAWGAQADKQLRRGPPRSLAWAWGWCPTARWRGEVTPATCRTLAGTVECPVHARTRGRVKGMMLSAALLNVIDALRLPNRKSACGKRIAGGACGLEVVVFMRWVYCCYLKHAKAEKLRNSREKERWAEIGAGLR